MAGKIEPTERQSAGAAAGADLYFKSLTNGGMLSTIFNVQAIL
jgi:hypothetical protein